MVCIGTPHHFKFFKSCLPQIFTWSILEYFDLSVSNCLCISKFTYNIFKKIVFQEIPLRRHINKLGDRIKILFVILTEIK